MDFTQVRRMRSRVDAEYKRSYNRITFDLTGNGLSSDLSESYLSLRMFIAFSDTGNKLTAADYQSLLDSSLMISFGQNGMSYPASSLIKVARLYAGGNAGSPLEEVLWANVWNCTMHQLKNDFESLASGSLSNGTTSAFSTNGSLASQISALMKSTIGGQNTQLPVDIQIPLSDLFGICRSKNFVIDHPAIQSLIVELELEDTKNLFQLTAVGKKVPLPYSLAIDGSANSFHVSPEVNPFTCLPDNQGDVGQPSYKFVDRITDASGNVELVRPEGLHMVKGVNFNTFWDPSNNFSETPVNSIQLLGTWDASGALLAGYEVGNYVKLNFKWKDSTEKFQSRMIEVLDYITAVDISGTTASIVLSTYYKAPVSYGDANATDVLLDSFDLYYGYNPAGVNNIDPKKAEMLLVGLVATQATGVQTSYEQFKADEIKISDAVFDALIATGIVVKNPAGSYSGSGCPLTVSARPAITSLDASGNPPYTTPFMDYFTDPDSLTGRHIYTNQSKRIPVQGVESAILSCGAPDASGNRILKMKSFGFANNNSLQNATILKKYTGATPTIIEAGTDVGGVPATIGWAITFHKYRVNPYSGATAGFQQNAYTYLIDRAEIVLVQHSIDPTMPMSPIYSTLQCEVATIETSNLEQYNRQIVVNSPNCYNIILMCPQYSASTRLGYNDASGNEPSHFYSYHNESLISYARNTNSYRWSINNIDDTNRQIEVQTNVSKYPSSLHLEKLLDTLTNDDAKLKTLSGVLTVPRSHSDPVVCFPLRVYKAFDDMNTYLRPNGFTAQITLLGDSIHDMNILEGPIFFFKQVLKMIPNM
jgi:hypothetical protein